MDLALLRTFVAVHRAGSFTRAAALLGLSQPAVTSQIRTLERQLGRPLFHRRARGVTPTAVGDELAHKAAPHLDALLEITEAGRETAGALRTLHVAGPPEFLCLRVLPALAPLVGQGHTLRSTLRPGAEEALDGLAARHAARSRDRGRPRSAGRTGMRPGRRRPRRPAPVPVRSRPRQRADRRPAGASGASAAHLVPGGQNRQPRPRARRPRPRPAGEGRHAVVSPRLFHGSGAFQKRSRGPLFSHDRTSRGQTHRPRDPARR